MSLIDIGPPSLSSEEVKSKVRCSYADQRMACHSGNSSIPNYWITEITYYLNKKESPDLYRTLQMYTLLQSIVLLIIFLLGTWILRQRFYEPRKMTHIFAVLIFSEFVFSQMLNFHVAGLLDNHLRVESFKVVSSVWKQEWHTEWVCFPLLCFCFLVDQDKQWHQTLSDVFVGENRGRDISIPGSDIS